MYLQIFGLAKGTALASIQVRMHKLSVREKLAMARRGVEKLGSTYAETEFTVGSVSTLATGFAGLDAALGGGLPRGRICEVFGPETSGKTTVALSTVAQVQRSGGVAAYLDLESRLESQRAEMLGVKVDDLLVYRPLTAEQAFGLATALLSSGIDLLVFDSVAALVPKREFDALDLVPEPDWGGLLARAMRKLAGIAARHNASLLLLNQVREKVGVMFGKPEVTPGGRAIRHHATVRVEMRRQQPYKRNGLVIGSIVKATVVKHSLACAWSEVEFLIGHKIDQNAADTFSQLAPGYNRGFKGRGIEEVAA
jgi:recombination protein RecA